MNEFLNATDEALHDQIHEHMSKMDPKDLLDHPRLKVLDMLSAFTITGDVADIGCGSGYFGIGVAKRFNSVTRVDCIEASKLAVESVISRNIDYFGLSSKVKALEGSFDALPANSYDVVFAMGALHHSQNLSRTMQSIFIALKPGGLLVAQEPAMPDTTTHEAYLEKYNIVEERYGLRIRNGDRYDRFFRDCEYKYCLVNNGFNLCSWGDFEFSEQKTSMVVNLIQYAKSNGLKNTLAKILSKLKREKSDLQQGKGPSFFIEMKHATKNVKQKLFVAKKSGSSKKFHRDK